MTLDAANNRRWWGLASTCGVMGLVVLDETVVGIALPTISRDLALTTAMSHWVVNAYLLTFTCFVAMGGRLGDRHPRSMLFALGAVLFGLGSIGAGAAANGTWLIAARGLQGIGAALLFPISIALLTDLFPSHQRGRALGIQTLVGGLFMAAGPLVGGIFAEHVSWRWIFWINLPVVAIIGSLALVTLREPGRRNGGADTPPIDPIATSLLAIGLTGVTVGLMQGGDWGWTSGSTLLVLAGGSTMTFVFVLRELRRQKPLIDIRLLRIATFAGGNAVFFAFQGAKIAVFVFAALYLQHRLGQSPIEASIAIVVAVLPCLVTSFLAGFLADRFGSRRPLLIALLVSGVMLGLMAVAAMAEAYLAFLVPLILWGAVMPLIAVPARRALMSAVPAAQRGQASGLNLTIQMLGGTIVMAICGSLYSGLGTEAPVFYTAGGVTLAALAVAWFTVEVSPHQRT